MSYDSSVVRDLTHASSIPWLDSLSTAADIQVCRGYIGCIGDRRSHACARLRSVRDSIDPSRRGLYCRSSISRTGSRAQAIPMIIDRSYFLRAAAVRHRPDVPSVSQSPSGLWRSALWVLPLPLPAYYPPAPMHHEDLK